MTKITRNVILDLMPLYLAGEASQDTKELVEEYLETDKELAEMANQSTTFDLPKDVPVPLEKDQALQLYVEAKRQMTIRMAIIGIFLVIVMLFFGAMIILVRIPL
jgi:hypothetical protein